MPLKPEYLEPTLCALRGEGGYTQTTGTIGNFKTLNLCCIGVSAHANGFQPDHHEVGHGTYNTKSAAKYIGLTDQETDQWTNWNDELLLAFPTIADHIEAASKGEEYYKGGNSAPERST